MNNSVKNLAATAMISVATATNVFADTESTNNKEVSAKCVNAQNNLKTILEQPRDTTQNILDLQEKLNFLVRMIPNACVSNIIERTKREVGKESSELLPTDFSIHEIQYIKKHYELSDKIKDILSISEKITSNALQDLNSPESIKKWEQVIELLTTYKLENAEAVKNDDRIELLLTAIEEKDFANISWLLSTFSDGLLPNTEKLREEIVELTGITFE